MSDYARFRILAEASENSDYSRPYAREEFSVTYTPDEVQVFRVQAATTPGTTVELGSFDSVTFFAVKNRDTTNYVTVTWTDNGTANSVRLPAGEVMMAPGCTVANDIVLVADTANLDATVWVSGS